MKPLRNGAPVPLPSGLMPEAAVQSPLAELWGDVVDLRHLAAAIAIDAAISVAVYLVAGRIFRALIPTVAIAHAYAMLAGLLGCVAGGVICAIIFAPKRELVQDQNSDSRRAALDLLQSETGTLGRSQDLPARAREEMRELGLLDAFEAHASHAETARTTHLEE